MKIYIKNMVCLCCKQKVETEIKKMNLNYSNLKLGEIQLSKPITAFKRLQLKVALHKSGLELMDDKSEILVEKIVNIIINMIYELEEFPEINFSAFLTSKLNRDYHSLSALFSKIKGVTIEQFIILHKVERIKELIIYDELNLTEISYKLQYSSVQHLSNQFKKITGYTPTYFKKIKDKKRKSIENV